jgi:hypothetical protein
MTHTEQAIRACAGPSNTALRKAIRQRLASADPASVLDLKRTIALSALGAARLDAVWAAWQAENPILAGPNSAAPQHETKHAPGAGWGHHNGGTTMALVYRIQPAGLGIAGHRSLTSCGDLAEGVHVFGSLAEAARAVRGWVADEDGMPTPELVTITCAADDLEDNEDYEGLLLVEAAGEIVHRHTFADWDALHAWGWDDDADAE